MTFAVRSGIFILIPLLVIAHAHADGVHPRGISLDGSIGDSGPLELEGPDYKILDSYGRRVGPNLFHSFGKFNIHWDESATFSGPDGVENIIGRATGGEASWIDGLLRSEIPNADLYLINPAGMMFGPNASLDLGGSFHVSTADYLRMGENERFYSLSQAGEVLSVAPPSAFGFLDGDIAGISLEGGGWMEGQKPEEKATGLRVQEGKTLSFVGGDISMRYGAVFAVDDWSGIIGGDVVAPGGRIDLASVASAGEVVRTEAGMDVRSGEKGNITISDHITLMADGEGGGDIFIQGGKIVVQDSYIQSKTLGSVDGGDIVIRGDAVSLLQGAKVVANTHGKGKGGNVIIRAAETVTVAGISQVSKVGAPEHLYNRDSDYQGTDPETMSSIIARSGERDWVFNGDLNTDDLGDAGAISIEAETIALKDGALLSASVYGGGNGGDIELRASKSITGTGEGGAYDATMVYVGTYGASKNAADAGTLSLEAPDISFSGGAGVSSTSHGKGNGGQITIKADTVSFDGTTSEEMGAVGSKILTSTDYAEEGAGDGGNLLIEADAIAFSSGAFIDSGSLGAGNGGDVTLIAGSVSFAENARILTDAQFSGNGGNLLISSGKIAFSKDAVIDSGTFDTGSGGDVMLRADSVSFTDGARIYGDTMGSGQGGNIRIEAKNISFTGGADIDSDAKATGNGGSVTLKGSETIVFSGTGDDGASSRLSAGSQGAMENAGAGGAISVSGGTLSLSDKARITTAAKGIGDAGDIDISVACLILEDGSLISSGSDYTPDGGDAGTISIVASDCGVAITGGSAITTDAESAGGGKISVLAENQIYLLDGTISSSVKQGQGNGGDIQTESEFVILNDGSIRANAEEGDGGAIFIRTDNYIKSGASVVSATSARGNDGTVDIAAPELDVSQGLTTLPAEYLDAARWMATPCGARSGADAGSLFLTGKEAAPASPEDLRSFVFKP